MPPRRNLPITRSNRNSKRLDPSTANCSTKFAKRWQTSVQKRAKWWNTSRTAANGNSVEVEESDLLISSKNKEGFSVASDRGDTVALDVTLTPELVEEGTVREIVSKIQTMRKECDFVVTDHINVGYRAEEHLAKVFADNAAEIADGCLADSVLPADSGAFCKEWDVNGEKFTLYLSKV